MELHEYSGFLEGESVINCSTKEEYEELRKMCIEYKIRRASPIINRCISEYGENGCIRYDVGANTLGFSGIEFYKRKPILLPSGIIHRFSVEDKPNITVSLEILDII